MNYKTHRFGNLKADVDDDDGEEKRLRFTYP
jgi:hypothetical protein